MYNFFIWGTGKVAKRFVMNHYNDFFRDNSIVGFIDNSSEMHKKQIFDISVISPNQIGQYTYDYILVASSFDEEITHQIIEELHIPKEKILHMYNIYIFMYNYWETNYNLSKKRILYIGNKKLYKQRKDIYINRFGLNIIGGVDIDNLELIRKYEYDYVFLANLTMISSLKIKNKFFFEKDIIAILSREFGILPEKILCSVLDCYHNVDIKIKGEGCENPNKKFLIINVGTTAGLGTCLTNIANNVRYAKENGFIPIIDMMTYDNQYLYDDEIGRVNAWDKFFFQPSDYNIETVMKNKNVFWSAIQRHNKIKNKSNMFEFLKIKPELLKCCKSFQQVINNKKLLGVLFRGTDYVNGKPYGHNIQPTLNEMIAVLKEKLIEWGNFDGIYICTEVEEALETFKMELNYPVYSYPQKRFSENTDKYLANVEFDRKNDKYLRGVEYFSSLYILSKCNSLIAGQCGGTTFALMFNDGMYENKYLFNLGIYGIDDINNNVK